MTALKTELLAWAGLNAVQILGGEIIEDDTTQPYVSGTLRIARPASLMDINPRLGARLTLHARTRVSPRLNFAADLTAEYGTLTAATLTAGWQGWPGAQISAQPGAPGAGDSPTGRQWFLSIVEAVAQPDGSYELQLESDDGPYGRAVWMGEAEQALQGPTLRQALAAVDLDYYTMPQLLAGTFNAELPPGLDSTQPSAQVVPIRPGEQLQQAFSAALQSANARLISFGRFGVELVSADWTTTAKITVREADDLVEYDDSLQPDSEVWGDAVMVVYDKTRTAAGRPYVSVSYNVIFGPDYRSPLVVEIDGPSPIRSQGIDDRIAPAQALLQRAQSRAKPARIVAAANYAAQPRAQLRLERSTFALVGKIRSVRFALEAPYTTTLVVHELEVSV